jgi:hypothetical protein
MNSALRRQDGAVLITSLVMLVLLTLIVVSAIRTTTGMLQIVGNAQFRTEGIAAASQAIDQLIGSVTPQTGLLAKATEMNSVGTAIDINGDGTTDFQVQFTPLPACLSRSEADAYIESEIAAQRRTAAANVTQDTPEKTAAYNEANARLQQLGTCIAGTSLSNLCYWSLWRITSQVKDPFTGVNVSVTEGVRILVGQDDKVNNCG